MNLRKEVGIVMKVKKQDQLGTLSYVTTNHQPVTVSSNDFDHLNSS